MRININDDYDGGLRLCDDAAPTTTNMITMMLLLLSPPLANYYIDVKKILYIIHWRELYRTLQILMMMVMMMMIFMMNRSTSFQRRWQQPSYRPHPPRLPSSLLLPPHSWLSVPLAWWPPSLPLKPWPSPLHCRA